MGHLVFGMHSELSRHACALPVFCLMLKLNVCTCAVYSQHGTGSWEIAIKTHGFVAVICHLHSLTQGSGWKTIGFGTNFWFHVSEDSTERWNPLFWQTPLSHLLGHKHTSVCACHPCGQRLAMFDLHSIVPTCLRPATAHECHDSNLTPHLGTPLLRHGLPHLYNHTKFGPLLGPSGMNSNI